MVQINRNEFEWETAVSFNILLKSGVQPVVQNFLLFFLVLGEIVCRICQKRFHVEWISHELKSSERRALLKNIEALKIIL